MELRFPFSHSSAHADCGTAEFRSLLLEVQKEILARPLRASARVRRLLRIVYASL